MFAARTFLSGWPLRTLLAVASMPMATLAFGAPAPCTDTPDGAGVAPCADLLPAVTVAATLNPRPVGEVAADVVVITRRDMDRHLVQSLRDLVRYEPGVSVTASPGRFGEGGFQIRGLGGNRVLMEVDGVPIADSFSFGAMLSAGRNSVDLDAIKRVEILKGPASSLYGSDALGGVVSYVTKDPADYLGDGRKAYVGIKTQYGSVNRGTSVSGTLAAGSEQSGVLLVASHEESHALTNKGRVDTRDERRTRPDPRQAHDNSVLAKYVHQADSGRRDRLVMEASRARARTALWSAQNVDTSAFVGRDVTRRWRLGFDQRHENMQAAWADKLHWQVWLQDSLTVQESDETRQTGPGYFRHVEESFRQRVAGLKLRAFKRLESNAMQHDVTWGLDGRRTQTRELRAGFARNLATGELGMDRVAGNADDYPVRDFPPATTTTFGAFVQDEIVLADGALRIVPGVRMDFYRFKPEADALFDQQPLAAHVAGQRLNHLSPKLGVVWQMTSRLNAYAQYASGFRAPPYSDLGMLFSNLQHGYAAIPNPDLKPETTRSMEVGLRGESALGRFTVSAYRNQYHDFIASEHLLARADWPDWAAATPGLAIVFQSVNLTRARIEGLEAGGHLELGAWAEALEGWRLRASLQTARGTSHEPGGAGVPIDSVAPARAVLGVAYEGTRWGVEWDVTAVARKHHLSRDAAFRAPGHATLDVYAHWQPISALRLYVGVTNLGDRRYFDWGSLHGGSIGSSVETSRVIDRYSAPGRAFSAALRWTF